MIFDGKSVKGRICYSALMVLLSVFAMRDGAEFPWAENKDMLYDACPDGDNTVMFEIKRVRKQLSTVNSNFHSVRKSR